MKPSKMATTTTLKMKLLVDAKSQHVLFAEAGKDVVDFLFSLLSLPLATVVKLLSKKSMVGSVGNLYGSIENLDSTYLQYGAAKDALLRPAAFSPAACSGGSLRLTEPSSAPSKKFYKCSSRQNNNCLNYMTDGYNEGCPSCPGKMVTALEYVAPKQMVDAASEAAKGFVQDVVTYTVMDDLTVKPMSTISSIALAQRLRCEGLRLAPGEERAAWLQRGYRDTKGLIAVQDCSYRRFSWQEADLKEHGVHRDVEMLIVGCMHMTT